MQQIAQAWLVLKLTHSGTALGLVTALQFLPLLLFASYGGLIADRMSKRRLLLITQACYTTIVSVLWLLVKTGSIQLWMVYLFALVFGLVTAMNSPVRQSFISEMVAREHVRNAVSLNSSMVNLGRIIGPAIAGIIIATIGVTACFLINALSYGAVMVALLLMRPSELHPTAIVPVARGQLRAGFRYVRSMPVIFGTVVMLVIIGTLAYEFQVSLPLLARNTFKGDAPAYAALVSAMGIGAVGGGLLTASRRRSSPHVLVVSALLFGIALLMLSLAPSLVAAVIIMVFVGFASISFSATANSTLQLESSPEMHGRVMAFWTMGFLGSTAIGGPIIGWIGEHAGPRWGLALGGFAALLAALLGIMMLDRHRPKGADAPPMNHQAPDIE